MVTIQCERQHCAHIKDSRSLIIECGGEVCFVSVGPVLLFSMAQTLSQDFLTHCLDSVRGFGGASL